MSIPAFILKNIWIKHKNSLSGFTLIELLVTLIIVGILAAIAIPNFITQVGKGREAETKGVLGTIGRAQQGYHWEQGTFTEKIDVITGNGAGSLDTKYHNLPQPVIFNANLVKHQAIAINPRVDQVRDFAIGVYFDNGLYSVSVCQSADVDERVNVGDAPSDPCTNGGFKLK